MSLTYGFYNSLNHDRLYNAEDISRIFDGIVNDGIYESIGTAMMVTPSSGMTVNVGVGRAWFNHTWTYNDAVLPMVIDGSSSVYSRIDAIVLRIDTRRTARENTIVIVKGSESLTPAKPDISTGDPEVFQYPLCYITIRRGVVEITQADIENRVGMSETPFVTGILQVMSIDALIAQWNSEWQQWLASKPAEFAAYVEQKKADFDAWIEADKAEITAEHEAYTQYVSDFENEMTGWKDDQQSLFETWRSTEQDTFEAWEATQKSNFDTWFANISYVLDGDVAGHLQNEIDTINNNWDSLETELKDQVEATEANLTQRITETEERLTNAVETEIEASNEQLFNYYYGLDNKMTTILNGVITEVNDRATAVTTFTNVSGGKDIVTTITPVDGDYNYTKTVQIREVSGGKTITESYSKEQKEA